MFWVQTIRKGYQQTTKVAASKEKFNQSQLQQTTNFSTSFLIFEKNKEWYFMRIVCQQTILMKYHAYLLFLKKGQNLKLLSAANYRWHFKNKAWYLSEPDL